MRNIPQSTSSVQPATFLPRISEKGIKAAAGRFLAGVELKVVVQQIADARVEGGALGGGHAPLRFGAGLDSPLLHFAIVSVFAPPPTGNRTRPIHYI